MPPAPIVVLDGPRADARAGREARRPSAGVGEQVQARLGEQRRDASRSSAGPGGRRGAVGGEQGADFGGDGRVGRRRAARSASALLARSGEEALDLGPAVGGQWASSGARQVHREASDAARERAASSAVQASGLEHGGEPRPRQPPVHADRRRRDAERVGGLLDGEPGEGAALDDAGLPLGAAARAASSASSSASRASARSGRPDALGDAGRVERDAGAPRRRACPRGARAPSPRAAAA